MIDLTISRRSGNTTFVLFTVLTVASVLLGQLLELPYLSLIPAAFLFIYFALLDFRKVFFLLIILLPFTREFSLGGGFSLDVPGEPILICLLFIFLFYLLVKQKYDSDFLKHPVIQLLFVHLLWIFVTLFFSQKILISAKFFMAKLWYVASYVFLTGLFIKSMKSVRAVVWSVLIPTAITIVLVLLKHATFGFGFDFINEASSIFYRNHVNYAAFVSLLMPFIWLGATWYKKGTIPHLFLTFCKVLFLVAIYFAYARGAWLALFASVIFYYALKYRVIKLLLIPGLAGFLLLANFLVSQNKYLDFAPEFGKAIYHGNLKDHLIATIKNQDISTAERFYRWVGAVRMSTEHPVTGFGPGSFYHFYRHYTVTAFTTYVSDNPEKSGVHNYFLMTLVEQGIVGLAIFMIFTFSIFYYGVKAYHRIEDKPRKLLIATLLCSLVIIYVQLMLSDLVESIKIGGFFFLNIAILVTQMLYANKNFTNTNLKKAIPD